MGLCTSRGKAPHARLTMHTPHKESGNFPSSTRCTCGASSTPNYKYQYPAAHSWLLIGLTACPSPIQGTIVELQAQLEQRDLVIQGLMQDRGLLVEQQNRVRG